MRARAQGDDDTVFTDAAAAFRALQLGGAAPPVVGDLSSSSSSDEDEPDEAPHPGRPDARGAPALLQARRPQGFLGQGFHPAPLTSKAFVLCLDVSPSLRCGSPCLLVIWQQRPEALSPSPVPGVSWGP